MSLVLVQRCWNTLALEELARTKTVKLKTHQTWFLAALPYLPEVKSKTVVLILKQLTNGKVEVEMKADGRLQ